MTCRVYPFARKAANGSMPRPSPGPFVVNGGQLLQRWTNDYFLATPHRAVNRSGGERDALAFFCDANIDWPIAAVPTCDYVGGDARLALLAVIRVPATPPRRQRQSQ